MTEKLLKLPDEIIASIENIEKLIKVHMPTTEAFVDTIKNQALILLKQEELIQILKDRISNYKAQLKTSDERISSYERQVKIYDELVKLDSNRGTSDERNISVSTDYGVDPI
jgi:hypothetical protein